MLKHWSSSSDEAKQWLELGIPKRFKSYIELAINRRAGWTLASGVSRVVALIAIFRRYCGFNGESLVRDRLSFEGFDNIHITSHGVTPFYPFVSKVFDIALQDR